MQDVMREFSEDPRLSLERESEGGDGMKSGHNDSGVKDSNSSTQK